MFKCLWWSMEETGLTGSRLKVCTANVQGLLDKSLLLLFSPIESPSSASKKHTLIVKWPMSIYIYFIKMPEDECSVPWTFGVAVGQDWSYDQLWVITQAFKRAVYGKWDALMKNTLRIESWHKLNKQPCSVSPSCANPILTPEVC